MSRKWSAFLWLSALALTTVWLVWMQFRERAYDAFFVECQFCLLAILLVFGKFRLQWRWGLVLLAYPSFQFLVYLFGSDVPDVFSGKQAIVLVVAVLLSLAMRLAVLPSIGWSRIVPQFRIYDWMISVAATFVLVAMWRDDAIHVFEEGFIGRDNRDVALQIVLSTWGAVAICLPVIFADSKYFVGAIAAWCVILLIGVLTACWAYVNLADWDHAPLNICVGNPAWTTIAVGVTLYLLNRCMSTLGMDLLQGQDY
ncbi:hypothetical protein AB1K70_21325 [Bremerella sp. JC770]|uniref:hypothetical protein n=1 Tax=Bremerella sp. JC770 TaxID=3232137 RepID=UPI003459D79D